MSVKRSSSILQGCHNDVSQVCVGKHVANNSIFIDIAVTLWACNISRAKDPVTGSPTPIDVDGWIEDGLVV